MLLEFKTENYKSFYEELVFSLAPAPKQKGLDYSILKKQIGRKTYKGLCSAVIYGANASGKTNLIGAMETFKTIVLRGNIQDGEDKSNPNAAANVLSLIPSRSEKEKRPVLFSIKFTVKNLLVEYAFTIDLGEFLEPDFIPFRKILSESLTVNEQLVFLRKYHEPEEELTIGKLDTIKSYLVNAFEQNSKGAISLSQNSLNPKELFLMNGFKTMFSPKLVALITEWFDKKFTVIYRADAMRLIHRFDNSDESIYIEKTVNEAARLFGINSNALGYIRENDGDKVMLCSLFNDAKAITAISAEIFESYGTIRFVNIFPFIVKALLEGGVLVIDEFDASIHPMALMNIVNLFHNDEINVHRAQLIFNTHNPIFLSSNLFRRDEIKFMERDEDTHYSIHYSLSDFGTTGSASVRKNENYMKNYFIDRYGATKDVNFTPLFEKLINLGKEKEV